VLPVVSVGSVQRANAASPRVVRLLFDRRRELRDVHRLTLVALGPRIGLVGESAAEYVTASVRPSAVFVLLAAGLWPSRSVRFDPDCRAIPLAVQLVVPVAGAAAAAVVRPRHPGHPDVYPRRCLRASAGSCWCCRSGGRGGRDRHAGRRGIRERDGEGGGPGIAAASWDVTVSTFEPGCRTIPLCRPLGPCPVAVPPPPAAVAHVTCATPMLSWAAPERHRSGARAELSGPDVGDVYGAENPAVLGSVPVPVPSQGA